MTAATLVVAHFASAQLHRTTGCDLKRKLARDFGCTSNAMQGQEKGRKQIILEKTLKDDIGTNPAISY